jgi:hypothetical protein
LILTLILAVSPAAYSDGPEPPGQKAENSSPDAREKDEPGKYMSADEIRPGMKGYGLTVFSGAEIEKFDVEILSVIYRFNARSDLILARIAGGPIEKAGVIAGMSGSPIYIDGRMIGALAYAWAFSKDAIAGITPIEEMLRIFEFDDRTRASAGAAGETLSSSETEPMAWANKAALSLSLPQVAAGSVEMRPIATPMIFSGFSREAVEMFRPELEGWGIMPVIGGSSSSASAGGGPDRVRESFGEVSLEEGAAIGVSLVSGDLIASGIGTVTLNEGGRILAFGHPFLFAGDVDFPMTTAYIHTILPSLVSSSKIGSPLETVGTLNQDRISGIGGLVGNAPGMVPISLKIRHAGGLPVESFNFEIVRHRRMLPPLAGMALGSALGQSAQSGGKFTAAVHHEIELDGYPPISNDSFISGSGGFPSLAASRFYRDLVSLLDNRFVEVSIKSISIDVEVKEAVEVASITSARVGKDKLRPGDDIKLKVVMQPYLKDPLEKKFSVKIPDHFPEGKAFLYISAAPQTEAFERMRAPQRYNPGKFEDLLRLIDEDYPGNRLDVRLLVSDPGMVVRGREMPALPSSIFSVLSNSIGKEPVGITRASVMLKEQYFMDFEIRGAVIIPIEIDRRAL